MGKFIGRQNPTKTLCGTVAFLALLTPLTALARSGGPDAFGYLYADSSQPSGPALNWEDISASGTALILGDDAMSAWIPIGFAFDYYGTTYTQVHVCSNGYLTVLDGQSIWYSPQPLPQSGDGTDGVIAPWWTDLDPGSGGTIHYATLRSAPNRCFIVQFTNVPHLGETDSNTFQVKLCETSNHIEFHYVSAPEYLSVPAPAMGVGIENQGGTVGLQYFSGSTSLTTPLAVAFQLEPLEVSPAGDFVTSGIHGGPFDPPCATYTLANSGAIPIEWETTPTLPWLDVTPSTGTLGVGSSATVTVCVSHNPDLLPFGFSTNTLVFTNVTFGTSETRGVELTTSESLIVTPATAAEFSGPVTGPYDPPETTYTLTNIGAAPLDWRTWQSKYWFSIIPPQWTSPPPYTLQPGTSVTVRVYPNSNANALPMGVSTGTLGFRNLTAGTTPTRDAKITLLEKMDAYPPIQAMWKGREGGPFTVFPSGGFRTTCTVRNLSDTALTWEIVKNADWYDVVPSRGTLFARQSVVVTASLNAAAYSLPPGRYTDDLRIVNTGSGFQSWNSVRLDVYRPVRLPFFDGFESGKIEGYWRLMDDEDAQTTVTTTWGPLSGAYQLAMDGGTSATGPVSNKLMLAVDLAGARNVTLSFGMRNFDKNADAPMFTVLGETDPFDGVAISQDGWYWHEAQGLRSWVTSPGQRVSFAVDLDRAVETLGLSYNSTFLICFNHYDEGYLPEAGFTFDDISITGVYDALAVSPVADLEFVGQVGGPFRPASQAYALVNEGLAPLDWAASVAAPWLDLSQAAGALAPGASAVLSVSPNGNANTLAAGAYRTSVTVQNTTSGNTYIRGVRLDVLAGDFIDLRYSGETSPFMRVYGRFWDDRLGSSVAFGDVNGDGYDDMIVGVAEASRYGESWMQTAGEVSVIYGGADLRGRTIDLYADDPIPPLDETRVLGDDLDDRTGNAVASGDVNGDGYDDVIIGTASADGETTAEIDAGRVYIIYGSTSLPGALIDLGDAPGSSGETRINGGNAYDGCGRAVASGDVNGDGFDDIIIGAEGVDHPTTTVAGNGAAFVLYGHAGLSGTAEIDLGTTPGLNGETRIYGHDTSLHAGEAVASGDLNGDGFDDVIVGIPWSNGFVKQVSGEVWVIYGSADLAATTIVDLSTTPGLNGETRILGEHPWDRTGNPLATGDVDGDGFDDLVIGGAGTRVIYGRADLPASATLDLEVVPGAVTEVFSTNPGDPTTQSCTTRTVDLSAYIGQTIRLAFVQQSTTDTLTVHLDDVSLEAGGADLVVNGDFETGDLRGWRTIVVGSSGGWRINRQIVDPNYHPDTALPPCSGAFGAVSRQPLVYPRGTYTLYQDVTIPATASSATLNWIDRILNHAPDFVDPDQEFRVEIWTHFDPTPLGETRIACAGSASLASGDFNGDGYDDLLFGTIYAGMLDRTNAGAMRMLYGYAGLADSVVDLDIEWGDLRILGDNPGDHLGSSCRGGGDLDRDGFADFAALAMEADNPSIGGDNSAGMAVVVAGDGPSTQATVSEFFRAGNAPRRGVGGRLSPVARTWLAFDGGTTAPVTVTVTRSGEGISNLGNGSLLDVADVVWEVTTARTGFNSVDLTFQYSDAEIGPLRESDLVLHQAPALSGPWTPVASQSIDANGNHVRATAGSLSFFALVSTDQTPPSVAVEQASGQADPTDTLPIIFDVVFSEAVIDFDAGDVTMGGTVTGVTFDVTGSGAAYTILVTNVGGDGTLVPTIGAGVCTDAAGNPNTASTSVDNQVWLDRSIPSAAMSSTVSNPTNTSPIVVTVTFSEPVTGFEASDVAVFNATVGNFTGAGAIYGFDLIPAGQGLVTADIPAGVAHDAVGHGNTAPAQFRRTVDTIGPTVWMSSFVPDPTNFYFITVTAIFSEPVLGFDETDIVVSNGMVLNFSGSDTNYGFLLVPFAPGLVTADIPAGAVQDAAGNGNAAARFSRDYDVIPPMVASIVCADPTPTSASLVHFTVSFDENVTGVDTGDFAVAATGLTGATVAGTAGSGSARTVAVNTGNGEGTVRLDLIDDDTIRDGANNLLGGIGMGNGDFSAGEAFTIDRTGPRTNATGPSGKIQQSDPVIEITFAGSDANGLRGVRLFYRKRPASGFVQYGGLFPASPIQFDTSATGGAGTYDFYTLGVDNAGNVERPDAWSDITVDYNVETGARDWRGYP